MLHTNERTLVSFDWAMKRLLRDKANFDVLEGFLSALLNEEIRVVQLLESEANQESATDKFNRVDLLVQDSQGIDFIIEVQYSYAAHFLKRLLFGVAKLITERLEAGDEYGKVEKIISISLLYFPVGESNGERDYVYHSKTEFYGIHNRKLMKARQDTLRMEDKSKETGRETAEKHNIFPEYYLIDVNQFPNIVKDGLDEWIYFFKNSDIPEAFKAKNIQTARQKLNRMKMSVEEREAYDHFLLARAGYLDEIQSAKEEGRKEGLEEGRQAERLAIARMMQQNGMALPQISQMTGLSEAEIVA